MNKPEGPLGMARRYFMFSCFVFIFVILGCAGFSYRYYGLDAKSYEGTLLGPSPQDDLPLSTCQPDPTNKGKCVVLYKDEFYKFKADYQNVVSQLKACQSSH